MVSIAGHIGGIAIEGIPGDKAIIERSGGGSLRSLPEEASKESRNPSPSVSADSSATRTVRVALASLPAASLTV